MQNLLEKREFKITNYDIYSSFTQSISNPYAACLLDFNGKQIEQTQHFFLTGLKAFNYLCEGAEVVDDGTPFKPEDFNSLIDQDLEELSCDVDRLLAHSLASYKETVDNERFTEKVRELNSYTSLGRLKDALQIVDLDTNRPFIGPTIEFKDVFALGCLAELNVVARIAPTGENCAQLMGCAATWVAEMEKADVLEDWKKQNAKKGARKRHAENRDMKREVLEAYEKRKSEFKSIAAAARALKPLVPVTLRTIEYWLREHNEK